MKHLPENVELTSLPTAMLFEEFHQAEQSDLYLMRLYLILMAIIGGCSIAVALTWLDWPI